MTQNPHDNPQIFDLSNIEGHQAVTTLLNLMPDPAILYHRTKDQILTANNSLFLLTSLGEKDFIGQPINTLLPNLFDTDPISGHDKPAHLRHKKLPPIKVRVRIFPLTSAGETLVLILKPEEPERTNKQILNDHSELIEAFTQMIDIGHGDEEIENQLSQILVRAATILNVDVVCLYKASGSLPQLRQYLSSNHELSAQFPNLLTSEELSTNQVASLWTSDNLATTHMQKTAASAGYEFLVNIPMGQESARFALFVAGGKSINTNTNLLSQAKLIASYLTGFMENRIALKNIRNLNHKIKQVVKIQNEIVTNLDEGLIILSPDLTVAEINPAAETILGYANIETLRQPIDTILIGSESLGSAFTSAKEGIPTLTGGDLKLHHRTGQSFPAQVMMSPVMSNGKLFAIIILIRDMSQQEQSQTERKQLEQRAILGEVTAIFAHEVRNPINAIMLSLQVIEEDLEDHDPNLKWIDNIRDECNKLMYLMDSVLSFAKPLEYKMSGVDLDFLLTKILERWHPRLLRLDITSYYETELDQPIIEGDLRALEQVFTNLISNSVNAMSDKGGSMGIRVTETEQDEDQKFIQITLTDSGHGIPDDIKNHMFKPFVTGSEHGTGLGLAITQRIINAHKGKIEVDSFPGGTIFKVFLLKKKGLQ